MSKKTGLFNFDWWVVQKRVIYLLVAIFVLCGLAAGAALYVWKYGNPLRNVGTDVKLASGARFISFEGDVRVIRSATRETIVPGADSKAEVPRAIHVRGIGRMENAAAPLGYGGDRFELVVDFVEDADLFAELGRRNLPSDQEHRRRC